MQRRITRYAVILIALFSFVSCPILAQQLGPVVIGQKLSLHSEVLKEDRILWIYTPDTVHSKNTRFPIMVLLDGDTHFAHTAGIAQFLSDAGRMPKMIIVGVQSTDRVRDFTPADSSVPGSGGAAAFLRFINDELLPFVESHYATAPFRLLAGHSLGGSLVLNTLLSQPHMFNSYFILSPNLWWADDALVKRLELFLKNTQTLNAFVYETHTPKESAKNLAALTRLWGLLESYHVDKLAWSMQFMQHESHESIVHKSIYDGLEWLFSPWELHGDLAVTGLSGLEAHFAELSHRYDYSIEPDEELVNGLGYELLFGGKIEEAMTVFKWNVQHYPNSSNVYDSMGEAYAKKGDTKLAIENYEMSVRLNPKNSAAIEIIKKLKAK